MMVESKRVVVVTGLCRGGGVGCNATKISGASSEFQLTAGADHAIGKIPFHAGNIVHILDELTKKTNDEIWIID